MSSFFVPPIFTKYANAVQLLFEHGLLDPFCICRMEVSQILSPSVLVYLYVELVLTVSKVVLGEKLLTSHLSDLGLISTSLVPPGRVDLDLLCCCDIFSNKGCEFVVSADTADT